MLYNKDYSAEFDKEFYNATLVSNDANENYISMINQCLFSIKLNKKLIEVHSTGDLMLNKIIVKSARESILESQEEIKVFSSKIK